MENPAGVFRDLPSSFFAEASTTLSSATLMRDPAEMEGLRLIVKEKSWYKRDVEIMGGYLPMRKARSTVAGGVSRAARPVFAAGRNAGPVGGSSVPAGHAKPET